MNIMQISRSAHRTSNFKNPEFQFPQFKGLQSGVLIELLWHFVVYFNSNLKNLFGKNIQKVNKQNIRDL